MIPRVLLLLIAAVCLCAQVRTPAVREELTKLLAPAGISVPPAQSAKAREASRTAPEGIVVLRLRWGSPFAVLDKKRGPGSVPSLRGVRLRPDVLFLAAVDGTQTLLSWQIVPDPRVLRSEAPGADGVLTGRTVRVENPEFTVEAPDDPAAVELRIFEPRWTGKKYELSLSGTVPLK
jgi:hypothetical protein